MKKQDLSDAANTTQPEGHNGVATEGVVTPPAPQEPEPEYDFVPIPVPEFDDTAQGTPEPGNANNPEVAVLREQLQYMQQQNAEALAAVRQWQEYAQQQQNGGDNGLGDYQDADPMTAELRAMRQELARLAHENQRLAQGQQQFQTQYRRESVGNEIKAGIQAIESNPEYGRNFINEIEVATVMRENPRMSGVEASKVAAKRRAQWLNERGMFRRTEKARNTPPPYPGARQAVPPPSFNFEPLTSRDQLEERMAEVEAIYRGDGS